MNAINKIEENNQAQKMEKIKELLRNPQTTLPDVLTNPDCYRALKMKFPPIIEYFTQNSKQLLKYALTMSNKIGQFAYTILMENDPSITSSLVSRDSITEAAKGVFSGPPSHLFVARLADISFIICTLSPDSSIPVSKYLSHFILFGEEPDVLDLFAKLLSPNPIAQHIQTKLIQAGFVDFLVKSICNANSTDHLGGTALYVIGLFKIISMCGKAPVVGPEVQRPDIAVKLLRDFPTAPFQVKNARWSAVLSICTKDNASAFYPLLDQACRELSFGPQLYEYQLDAIHLLLRFSTISPNVSQRMVQLNFAALLGTILQKFPNHTFGHSLVGKVFRDTLHNPILGPHVFTLLPFIADAIVNRKQIVLSAFSLSLLMDLMSYANAHKEMVQILENHISQTHPCWNYARSAGKIFSEGYGGPLPDPSAPPIGNGPNAIAH